MVDVGVGQEHRVDPARPNDAGFPVAIEPVALLEHAAVDGDVRSGAGVTDLFIYPGYRYRCIDALITNFHLPRSTLFMLVSAFAGRQAVVAAYREAIALRYRFYSYGDAMLIV